MNGLTAAMNKLIELDARKAEIKQFYEDLRTATENVAAEIGVGGYFKDTTTGIVYKIVEPDGKFVAFDKLTYHRTKKPDEKRGDLSAKEAETIGDAIVVMRQKDV